MTGSSVLFDAPGPRARRISLIASIVALVIIAGALAWLIWTLATPRVSGGVPVPAILDPVRWSIFTDPEVWGAIGRGVVATLQAAAVAAVGALVLGVAFSLMRSSTIAWVRIPTAWLLEFLRGMPVLLMMLFILLVASTGAFWAVVIALALYNGTLIGEALRAGLAALPRGQREAALSVGMRTFQAKRLVEFPQAFRQMLPIIVAQLVVLLKDTSLGYIVGYNELIRTMMNNLATFYGNRYLFSLFFVCLIIYLAINLSLSWFARWLARRTASGGGRRSKPAVATPGLADPTSAIRLAEASAAARQSGGH
ncbi:glutamate transport system permease protein [Microbacterium terrae]|uniref:Arginine transport system permease protein ArtQ n=1 Tax=Microbacterium terrae TaxID=69369 RepID=A0A0M2GYM5_9MICO|nr:ABC transporter permease subunit [Microbacterium terrae]KJL39147.1 Arginine transport system permease protein ArtQ [Microbacterium terrae]MBP1077698.1 glutamate transport system permease protein [Microbacterium terrae]GLJ99865.1 glutamate ABC transporter permease [Microbacterium terrae]